MKGRRFSELWLGLKVGKGIKIVSSKVQIMILILDLICLLKIELIREDSLFRFFNNG